MLVLPIPPELTFPAPLPAPPIHRKAAGTGLLWRLRDRGDEYGEHGHGTDRRLRPDVAKGLRYLQADRRWRHTAFDGPLAAHLRYCLLMVNRTTGGEPQH